MELQQLLAHLAQSRRLEEILEAAEKLESEHGFHWLAVSGREGNYGSINIGSDPGHAFVERVTNAIDAVIEREALRRAAKGMAKDMPASPREAVEAWFNVPSGRVSKLPINKRQALADEVIIRILEGASKKQPTLEIIDHGIGLTPNLIPRTILSLNDTNKINKPYLAGAYGQGGSTALAFSPKGTLITSRRHSDLLAGEPDEVAVTLVRYNELDPNENKNGRYEFLVMPESQVASIPPTAIGSPSPGTSVVHFHMELPQYSSRMTQLTGSLWWLLQNTLFDPVLPFWVEERRASMLDKGKEYDRRTIAGNYTRLVDDRREKIELHNSIEIRLGPTKADTIRVNYWVVKPNPENPGSQSVDVYVDPYRPIIFTFNGQSHGTEERRFTIERLSLPYLAKSLIIQIELDRLSPQSRRNILSTTRDRLKQTPLYEEIRESIASALTEDEELIRLNEERKERLLSKHSASEQAKMRERFARLMERFRSGVDVVTQGRGDDIKGRKERTDGSRDPLQPLPTKPEPTFLRIANTQRPIPIRIDRHSLIRLESDAPDGYITNHIHAKLWVHCDPEGLVEQESTSDFLGGRSRLTLKPTSKANPKDSGSISVLLLTSTGKVLSTKAGFRIEKAEEQPTSGNERKSQAKVPEPVPIHQDQWNDFGWNSSSVAQVNDDGKDIKIFVNMDNRHLAKALGLGGYQESGVKRVQNSYLLYVAFYAWLQYIAEAGKDLPLQGKEFEEYRSNEFDRISQTVIHSVSASSRIEEEV
jgi:hypothetical protein